MTGHHKDLCRCGSGKRYKHCHLPIDRARRRRALTWGGGGVLAVALAVGAWALTRPPAAPVPQAAASRPASAPAGDAPAPGAVPRPDTAFGLARPATGGVVPAPPPGAAAGSLPARTTGSLAPGENPAPWEYDVEHDRHYDPRPEHRHWHQGPPPAGLASGLTAPAAGANGPMVITGKDGTPIQIATPLAPGEHPAPWEYDATRNRYFDPSPGHNHWHPGKPPANAGRTTPSPAPTGTPK